MHQNQPGCLIFRYGNTQVRRNRYVDSEEKRRPYRDVVVALVDGGDGGRDCDLLGLVVKVDVELVVVNADAVVWVVGGQRDLDSGRHVVRFVALGEVEFVHSGILESEFGLVWTEDEEDDQYDEEN